MNVLEEIDFSRWAVVGYNDETGLGRMAQDAMKVLGLGRHLVAPSARLSTRPLTERQVLLDSKSPADKVREALEGLQGIIVLEKPSWHPELLPLARSLGIRTVAVPMWEWFWPEDPLWAHCQLFVCPNFQCLRMVRRGGLERAIYLPWVLDLEKIPGRFVTGPGRTFIHNAGLIDPDDRKGTQATLRAFQKVQGKDLRLVVRTQQDESIVSNDPRVSIRVGNCSAPGELYREGDVAVQPSRMEGLGLLILEAIASGMPVVTTDHPPMNEYGGGSGLLVGTERGKSPAFSSQWIPHAYLKKPREGSLVEAIRWCSENDLSLISKENRAWAEQVFNRVHLRERWAEALGAAFRAPRPRSIQTTGSICAAIPARNAEGRIGEAVESIRCQRLPVQEVVVVNDASTDRTDWMASATGAKVISFPSNKGRGAARKVAVEQCEAEFILFLDVGIRLEQEFLEKAMEWMKDPKVAAVFGSVCWRGNPRSRIDGWRSRHLFKTKAAATLNRQGSLSTGGALLRRKAVMEVGNFNPALRHGEDRDLGERLLRAGYEVVHDPTLELHTRVVNTAGEVLERYCRWNVGGPLKFEEYLKHVSYSVKGMAPRDLREGDGIGALLSLAYPHYALFRSLLRKST